VVGTPHVLLSTSQDLPLLSSTLPRLQQLHFAGGFTQLRSAQLPMQVRGCNVFSAVTLYVCSGWLCRH
jgi:hypothetical protein